MYRPKIPKMFLASDETIEMYLENQRAAFYKISTNNARRKYVNFKRLIKTYDLYYDFDEIKKKMQYQYSGHLINYLEKAMGYKFIQLYHKLNNTLEDELLKDVYDDFHFTEIANNFNADSNCKFFKVQLENNVKNPWRKIRMHLNYFKYLKGLPFTYSEMLNSLKETFFDRKYETLPIYYPNHEEAYEVIVTPTTLPDIRLKKK